MITGQNERVTGQINVEETIINTIIATRNNGKSKELVRQLSYHLKTISENANLANPEEVKAFVANSKQKRNKEPTSEAYKNKMLQAYNYFCQTANIEWKKPYYNYEPKIPLIPSTENVNKIIDCASPTMATCFTILTETGVEGHELDRTSRKDIDAEKGIISIQGCKGHLSGNYTLKKQTTEMLRILLHKRKDEHPFPKSKIMGESWIEARNRAITKFCQPDLKKIPMKNLRNYSGAQLYYKIPDPIAVMRHLRHRKLETTMHYLSGITTGGEEEYTCKTATTLKEATDLIEHGFQYITDIDNIKLFKKRK